MVANVPPHQLPPNALAAASFNTYVDIDGNLKCRLGYTSISSGGNGFDPYDYPTCLINYHNAADQTYYTVMQGISTWQYWRGEAWNNITNNEYATTGSFDLPGRFAVFFQEIPAFPDNGVQSVVYGVNGYNGMRYWFTGLATNFPVQQAPVSRDIEIIANRVITVCCTEGENIWEHEGPFSPDDGNTFYPYRVRWSEINDGTTWGVDNFADLEGGNNDTDYIIAVKALNNLNAAIYREQSIWLMTAVPGTDATAFDFELAPNATGINGPVNAACVVSVYGTHYFFGTDNRIWTFDGVTAYPISQTIDPVLLGMVNNTYQGRFSAAYFPPKRQIWFFFVPFSPPVQPYVPV